MKRNLSTVTPRLVGIVILVLGLLSHGLTTQQIADRLERSYWTVRIHQQNIVAKLGARDRTHAACLAVMWEMAVEA